MSTITFKIGHVSQDLGELMDAVSPKPPMKVPFGINSKEYLVGTDFTSGDTLVFSIAGTDKIRFAQFTTPKGVVLPYTEASITGGLKITLDSAVTANVKSLVIFNT